jgi:hypothetical protein
VAAHVKGDTKEKRKNCQHTVSATRIISISIWTYIRRCIYMWNKEGNSAAFGNAEREGRMNKIILDSPR